MGDKLFYVWGGVFTDMQFRDLTPGSEESYGPFHSEAEAEQVWSEKARAMIDIAQHRMFVITVPLPKPVLP
jgi:hypothetical protein